MSTDAALQLTQTTIQREQPVTSPAVTIRRDRAGEAIGEESLSRFFADYVQHGGMPSHLLLRPRALARAVIALERLPVVHISTGAGADGDAIRATLRRPLRLLLVRGVNAVLTIPASRDEYLAGRPKHALRQNIRAAERAGLTSRLITDQRERTRLLEIANRYERINPNAEFRNDDPDNDDMMPLLVWMLTSAADGRPLLLAAVAVDGPVAMLRYYRTLGDDAESSVARFYTMPNLVDCLRDLGVTHLAETARPHWLPNSLRQFQRKVGFRLMRLAHRRAV